MMKSEIRDGMQIDWDAPVAMDDGVVLRADVFRPMADGKYPVILSYGPYAKGLAMQEGYKSAWMRIVQSAPEVLEGSSNKYQNWELFDPEKWVPERLRAGAGGFARRRAFARLSRSVVAARGAGHRAVRRLGRHAAVVERQGRAARHLVLLDEPVAGGAAQAEASGGAVHLGGLVRLLPRALPPRRHPHRTSFRAGIRARSPPCSTASASAASRAPSPASRSPGPPTLSEEELKRNRADCDGDALRHRLIDDYYRARLPKFEDIETPLLSAANWGGMGLHPRGNFEGFLRAGSKQKWLEVHGDTHFTLFYAKYGHDLQKQFFDHFLKGEDNGWERRPKVLLNVRHPGEKFVPRAENEWPLARTQWTKFYLHPTASLRAEPAPRTSDS